MPYERAGKHITSKDLPFRGLTFLTHNDALCLPGLGANIAEASRLLYPLLSSPSLPYKGAFDWLQFAYTGNRFGAYMDPVSSKFSFHTLADG